MKKQKQVTVKDYLKNEKNKQVNFLLNAYYLSNVSIELFFRVFEEVEKTPEAVINFILEPENSYELSVFGARATNVCSYSNGYNGKGNYQGTKSTIGASHSNIAR